MYCRYRSSGLSAPAARQTRGVFHGLEPMKKRMICCTSILKVRGILLVLQHCFEIRHTLFYIVSKHLVQAKTFGVVELFEEVLHEVLQESISAIEFKEVTLINFFGRGSLEFPLFFDV